MTHPIIEKLASVGMTATSIYQHKNSNLYIVEVDKIVIPSMGRTFDFELSKIGIMLVWTDFLEKYIIVKELHI